MGRLLPHVSASKSSVTPPTWPSYTGPATFVGTSHSGVSVWVDARLGAQATKNATDLLADADRIMGANSGFFGTPNGAHVNVIVFALGGVTDGTGGADHMSCDFVTGQNIEVCTCFGNSMVCSALFEAELSECSMNGHLCGESTGEALSRWCAFLVSNNALGPLGFSSAPAWVADGMSNWVDQTEGTDRDYNSIGCGMAFISWLLSKGYSLSRIAPAMVSLGDTGTLSHLYAMLSGDSMANAWPLFSAAVRNLSGGVTSDDPFNGASPVPPPPPPPPPSGANYHMTGTLTISGHNYPVSGPVTLTPA